MGQTHDEISILSYFPVFWPILFAQFAYGMSFSGLLLNLLKLSHIIFQDNVFHATKMGLVLSAQTWAMAISGIVIGRISDKWSRKQFLIVSLILGGLGRALMGFTPISTKFAYPFFIFCSILSGLGRGGFNPIIISLTNDLLHKHIRSRFFGIYESMAQIGSIIGVIFSAIIIQSGYWQYYFWGGGVIILFSCFIIFFKIHEPKRGLHSHSHLTKLLTQSKIYYQYELKLSTIKSTILSPTNIIAFIEGIFTWFIIVDVMYLIYPYIQSPPYNISAVSTSVLMSIFGIPGTLFGALFFSKLSDRLGKKDIRMRVVLIIISLMVLLLSFTSFFIIPFPYLNVSEGNNLTLLFSFPELWLMGLFIFILRAFLGIYNINQNPILQAINLPEAQGTVTAWGQFLETISMGLGPVIAGYILDYYAGNYLQAAIITVLIGTPGIILWCFAFRYIDKDVFRIQNILQNRAIEMEQDSENEKFPI